MTSATNLPPPTKLEERAGYQLVRFPVVTPGGHNRIHYVVIGPDGHRNEFKTNAFRAKFWFDCWVREVERKQVQS